MNILPNLDKIKIPEDKFINYALNPVKSKDKAIAFDRALGYTIENYEKLVRNILANISNFSAIEKGDKGYGMTYEVLMYLIGENGKTAAVKTAWIDDFAKNEMRLISAYIDER